MKHVCATVITLAAGLCAAGPAGADPVSQTGHNQLIDRVIQRALSQRGVPFVYGGGTTSGPTAPPRPATARTSGVTGLPGVTGFPGGPVVAGSTGPDLPGASVPPAAGFPGAATVGFDASGLIQYAFAGAGIKMPRTSGDQCSVGRKVTPEQALPGDLLCYGPGGTQSVALFLGNGQMIEGTNPAVTVTPARTSNMVPYLTRVIG